MNKLQKQYETLAAKLRAEKHPGLNALVTEAGYAARTGDFAKALKRLSPERIAAARNDY